MREGIRNIVALLTALFFYAASGAWAQAEDDPPQELRVVFIAYENPDQLVEDVQPVVVYLEQELGLKVRHFVATDYAGVVEALRNETADVGFMGPLQYVITHDQADAYPILGEIYSGKSTYFSRIFVRKDSGIESPQDLRGRTIAFVDPISSSGYMCPLDIFKRAGLIEGADDADNFFRRIYFAGGDEQAIRAVLNGFVDAAGIGQYAYNLLRPEERDEVVYIAESQPIPSHCLVARKGLKKQTVARLQAALLALNDGPQHGLLKHLYNVDGYVKVTHADYEGVERMAREYGFLRSN
ncbi:phosphate/phosphite/phosphonate ABC transporter substrate-binding protein [bacterium]|nr:phosphate/phosphite/phosphonate ABC transporter substrate-binding protein [bacterium]